MSMIKIDALISDGHFSYLRQNIEWGSSCHPQRNEESICTLCKWLPWELGEKQSNMELAVLLPLWCNQEWLSSLRLCFVLKKGPHLLEYNTFTTVLWSLENCRCKEGHAASIVCTSPVTWFNNSSHSLWVEHRYVDSTVILFTVQKWLDWTVNSKQVTHAIMLYLNYYPVNQGVRNVHYQCNHL